MSYGDSIKNVIRYCEDYLEEKNLNSKYYISKAMSYTFDYPNRKFNTDYVTFYICRENPNEMVISHKRNIKKYIIDYPVYTIKDLIEIAEIKGQINKEKLRDALDKAIFDLMLEVND